MVKNLLNLFFPKICLSCSNVLTDNEAEICTSCRHELPLNHFSDLSENMMTSIFKGRVDIQYATALLKFRKRGRVQNLLHNLKYRGMEQIGPFLGRWLGDQMLVSEEFRNIDLVIPVPLHKSKRRKRGYNQVSGFAQAIARKLNSPYSETILRKKTSSSSQVFKKRKARWQGSDWGFELNEPALIEGKHILLVDDLVTTGSTLEACISTMRSQADFKISLATMAIAD